MPAPVSSPGSPAAWAARLLRVRCVYAGGRKPAPATARLMTSEEAAGALEAYAGRHPRAWAALKPVFEAALGARIDDQGTSLPMVMLDLATGSRLTSA